MALPPEYCNGLLGEGVRGHQAASLDFQARILLFGHPLVAFLNPVPSQLNPVQAERVRHMVHLYKTFVRRYLRDGRIFHHTPVVTGPEPQGWGVLELASRDRLRAIVGLFQLATPNAQEYLLRVRGLDAGRRYRVTFDNDGQTSEVDGLVLMKQGLVIRVEAPLASELLF